MALALQRVWIADIVLYTAHMLSYMYSQKTIVALQLPPKKSGQCHGYSGMGCVHRLHFSVHESYLAACVMQARHTSLALLAVAVHAAHHVADGS